MAVYIGDTLNTKRCPLLEPNIGEFICLDLHDSLSHHLICFHRLPNTLIADFIDVIYFILSRAEALVFSN